MILYVRTGALPQHIVRVHGNDVAQRKNERVDVFHVQVVGSHRIGDRVVGQLLGLLHSVADHVFGVDLERVVAELRFRDFLHCNEEQPLRSTPIAVCS